LIMRGNAVGIATGYGLDDGEFGVRIPVGPRIFSSPTRLDRLWGPPNLLFNEYWGTPRDRVPGTHWIDRWVGPSAELYVVDEREISCPSRK
jgi:hypothetical protein